MRRPGLRTRVTAIFAGGALILTASMALLSYELTRSSLLAERERTATRTTYFDASVVEAGLAAENVDPVEVLRSLNTGAVRRPLVLRDGVWYARDPDVGLTDSVPEQLQALAQQGQPAGQRVRTEAGPAFILAVPLGPSTVFFEVHSLQELESTLQVLALVLGLVAGGTTVAGAAIGWYATRRSLRPLATVAAAAQGIAAGDLTARLDPAAEPELQRLTDSFNDMVDQLSQRIERDRRFAADVSHELRSPLQTLSAAVSVLTRRRSYLDERTGTAVRLVADELARFQHLVTDLLELARTDRPADLSEVDVGDLTRQVCQTRGLATDLVTWTPGADTVWQVDRRRFEQILANLLDNADRHGGGATAVRLGQARGVHYLEVDDEGPGVRPEERQSIFNPFVRGRPARARGDGDGTGLGLAIVAQHVAAHGGRVRVSDRPGGGSRFRVEVPERPP
jgi:two-component system sensor histidine kinase MtrB